MPGGSRRLPRTVRSPMPPTIVPLVSGDITSNKYSPLGSSVPTLPGLEHPSAPKHIPFPNTPVDSDIFFELYMFVYACVATALQFLHLYRSVWWLPHSYTDQTLAIWSQFVCLLGLKRSGDEKAGTKQYSVLIKSFQNFYLIDGNLVAFILIILSRRIVYLLGCRILDKFVPEKHQEMGYFCYRMFLFGVTVLSLTWCAYFVIQNHPTAYIFYLSYPFFSVSVYLAFCGFTIAPFFELFGWDLEAVPPLHACSVNPVDVRAEVENLKSNFNNRLKNILFTAVLNSYYAAFVPCCFAQSFLYYDIHWASQHVVFVCLGGFSAYAMHMLPLRYCDTLHRSALHIGYWDRIETTRSHLPVAYTWQDDTLWPFGSIVRHGRELYRALGECNAAEPGNTTYSRFYTFFMNPSLVLAALLALQVSLVLFQLTLLMRSTFWYHIVSVTLLLFFNYYTVFKIGRNYCVSSRIYKAEEAMHEKITEN